MLQTRQSQIPTSRPSAPAPPEEATVIASVISLSPGLFSVHIEPLSTAFQAIVALPPIHISRFPAPDCGDAEILDEDGFGEPWLGSSGGVVAVRSPPDGGAVIVTVFGPPGSQPALPVIRVARLQGAAAPQREIPTEILLHVERLGDRRFSGQDWVGGRGRRLRVEGISITPLEGLPPRDLEYQGIQPGGVVTPWVSGAQFCGSRGRRTPLTGFAVRLAPHVRDRFDIVYSGSFINSGVAGPQFNGEPCCSPSPEDPLEAMTIRIVGLDPRTAR